MSSDSVKFQLFLVGVHCQFVALSVWYASNAHQRLLLFKVSHDHINCKKVDGVCSLDSLKICCMGCSTETDAWGASSWKRGHAGSWIPNSELLVNLTRNYSGFMFNLSIWSGTCVAWIQNQKPTFSPPLSSTGVAPALGEARRGRGRPHCLEPERLGKRDDALNGSGGGHFIPEKNKGCLCGVNIEKTMEHYHF